MARGLFLTGNSATEAESAHKHRNNGAQHRTERHTQEDRRQTRPERERERETAAMSDRRERVSIYMLENKIQQATCIEHKHTCNME